MATNTETLKILINAQDNASSALQKLQGNILSVGKAWLSWRVAKEVLRGTIGEAIESERVWANISQTIKNTGQNLDITIPAIKHFAKETMYWSGQSDEAIGEAVASLSRYGIDAQTAMRGTSIAMQWATAKGMDLATVSELLGRAWKGHSETLARYGMIVKKTGDNAADFNAILSEMSKQAGGTLQANLNTLSGQFGILRTNIFELGEDIGTATIKAGGFTQKFMEAANVLLIAVNAQEGLVEKARLLTNIIWGNQEELAKAWLRAHGLLIDTTTALKGATKAAIDWSKATNDLIDKFREQDTALENTTTYWLQYMKVIQSGGEVSAAAGKSIDEAFNASLSEAIDNAADGLERAEAAYQKILKESNTVVAQPLDVSGGDQYGEGFSDISKYLQDTQKKASKTQKFLKDVFSGAVFESFNNAASNAASMLTRVFMGEKVKFVDLWKSMASDFLNYFLQEILKQAAIAIAKLVIQFAMFDNPKNDAIAYRSGRDYMKHFTNGMNSGLPDAGSFSLTPAMAGGGSFGGGGTTVIMIGGGSDYKSMRKRLEKEVSNGSLDLITRRNINQALITMKGTGR